MTRDTHDEARALIALGEALSDAQQIWLWAHLQDCATCRDYAQVADRVVRALRSLPVAADTRLVRASLASTYTLVGSPKHNIQVVVVDTRRYGVQVIHDLRLVFPDIRVLALTSGLKGTLTALQAGATMALPRTSSPAQIANAIDQLAHPRG